MIKDFFSAVVNTCVIACGWMALLWGMGERTASYLYLPVGNEIALSCYFMFTVNFFTTLVDLPFSIYHTFVLEAKHGFNKQTPEFFFKDKLKSYFIGQIISIPLTSIAVYIVQSGSDMFIVWLWVFSGVMILLLVTIYPAVIAPLFDKYNPLPDGPLRTSIEQLAASLKFPLGQLYVVEGSKRSAHSNAYFYGLFGTKRIVLFDTLLENYKKEEESEPLIAEPEKKKKGCSDAEVLAVLAHELGHWSHGHIHFNLVLMQINLLLMFAAFGLMFQFAPLYRALGFPVGQQPILVGMVAILQLVLAPYNSLLTFLMTVLSRRFEFEADNFAINLGHAQNLKKALIKLNIDNLGFPIYDPLYSSWHHSHPTLLQRMEKMDKKKER